MENVLFRHLVVRASSSNTFAVTWAEFPSRVVLFLQLVNVDKKNTEKDHILTRKAGKIWFYSKKKKKG